MWTNDFPRVADWEARIRGDAETIASYVSFEMMRRVLIEEQLTSLVRDVINAVNEYHLERELPCEEQKPVS